MAKFVPTIPKAPHTILKGSALKELLSREAVICLGRNIAHAHPAFPETAFVRDGVSGLEPLGLLQRGHHLAVALRKHLPDTYEEAVRVLLGSLTPPLKATEGLGLGIFFYLPHVCFVAKYGLDPKENGGCDPFKVSMKAQYELTRRFSAEFFIRPFLLKWPERTLKQLRIWARDKDPHVRRLCSEGTRPRLPWATRLEPFIKDPRPVLPILEVLKDDPSLYVRRSVANHLGDIAKDNLKLAVDICERWLTDASPERRWVIRHALRYPARKNDRRAKKIRELANV